MRWLRCSVLLVSCFACCGTAVALDPLLVEYGWSQPSPVTLPANYGALVDSSPWNGGPGVQKISQYPTNEFADVTAIAFWNQSCASGSFCGVGFSNGGQSPFPTIPTYNLDILLGGSNRLWADGWDGQPQPFTNSSGTFHAATFVPQKGSANQVLYGYIITAVEREVTATTQTIRLYGVDNPLPEPSSAMLVVLAVLAHFSKRCRR